MRFLAISVISRKLPFPDTPIRMIGVALTSKRSMSGGSGPAGGCTDRRGSRAPGRRRLDGHRAAVVDAGEARGDHALAGHRPRDDLDVVLEAAAELDLAAARDVVREHVDVRHAGEALHHGG